jgi:hypothetical protein
VEWLTRICRRYLKWPRTGHLNLGWGFTPDHGLISQQFYAEAWLNIRSIWKASGYLGFMNKMRFIKTISVGQSVSFCPSLFEEKLWRTEFHRSKSVWSSTTHLPSGNSIFQFCQHPYPSVTCPFTNKHIVVAEARTRQSKDSQPADLMFNDDLDFQNKLLCFFFRWLNVFVWSCIGSSLAQVLYC